MTRETAQAIDNASFAIAVVIVVCTLILTTGYYCDRAGHRHLLKQIACIDKAHNALEARQCKGM